MAADSPNFTPLNADPGAGFNGRIGPTLAESMPDWPSPRRAPAGSPNVVVILLDDLGYGDFGCFGGEIDTPNIDRLAANGLRYTNYTTVPMCTPARAALLTGKNPHSVGCGWLTHNMPGYPGYRGGEISKDAPTIPELLREHGWSTMAVGKWHNTYDRNLHAAGDRSSWPLQRGFDRFYGFLAAETSYFHPDRMMEGNQLAAADSYPEGYFATDDYTDRAIGWLSEHRSSAPDKAFFLYLAFQAPHTPLQAKPEDLARYRGRYDAGWDSMRAQRFSRQREMNLLEPNAELPPRNPGVPAWDELPEDQRALFARYMEVYAALVDNVDQNVGKLLDFLESTGQLENTLILITSDNGANSIGGPSGVANLQDRRQGFGEDPAVVRSLLERDRLGSEDTYAAYPSGWTQVSNTPYRYYKRTPMAGGIRVPLIAHWPQGIGQTMACRRQWVHVTDMLPTLLDLTGIAYPQVFNGYRTRQMDGASFAPTFTDAAAPQRRDRQYYELQGNRGFISGTWKIVSLQAPTQPADLDNWMLFDLANDPTEIHDLAGERPDVLRRLIDEFEAEASANYVYPLDTRDDRRAVTLPPHELVDASTPREFYPLGQTIPSVVVSALIADRDFTLRARFDYAAGNEGVIFAMGDRFAGMVAYVMDGALYFVYQLWYRPIELAPIPLAPGKQDFVLRYRALGERRGCGDFQLNGNPVREGVELSPTLVRLPSGGMDVGINRRLAICERYADRGLFRYSGKIDVVRLEPGPQPADTPMLIDEAAVQERMRAARASR
ncbi:arylsulfatase [Paraburkholderia pallida]|uniref:Arylsulfatase n=1 Tax=Paraburkholderia pallida TaxID=2547399 RepID=A0A4P7D7S0_9BURK|nr:arylsulfatase [Paraburkholderia pallida]QBR04238.1 arylsulfatase [Paraburkholderia pallida]